MVTMVTWFGVCTAEKNWYSNADEIAAFLSAANPNWPKADLKTMLDNHLNLTLSEAVATLQASIQIVLRHLIRFISRQR